jgi:hypothetical protein
MQKRIVNLAIFHLYPGRLYSHQGSPGAGCPGGIFIRSGKSFRSLARTH